MTSSENLLGFQVDNISDLHFAAFDVNDNFNFDLSNCVSYNEKDVAEILDNLVNLEYLNVSYNILGSFRFGMFNFSNYKALKLQIHQEILSQEEICQKNRDLNAQQMSGVKR